MEVVVLERRVKKAGWQVQAYLGPNGTEAELRATNSSCILDLAPHVDFSFPKLALVPTVRFVTTAVQSPKGKLVNPMLLSGLVLAGAHITLKMWKKGEVSGGCKRRNSDCGGGKLSKANVFLARGTFRVRCRGATRVLAKG
jgi:hypothetical protein